MKTYTFTVDVNDVAILAKALSAMPFGEVNALFVKLQGQMTEQDTPPAPKAKK